MGPRVVNIVTLPWLLCLVFAACQAAGDAVDGAAPTDATSTDALNIDADGPSYAPIHVMVYDENVPGQPAVGAQVIASGNGVAPRTYLTSADGTADVVSPPGATITVVQSYSYPPGTPAIAVFASFAALEPGDVVVAGPRIPRPQLAGHVSVIVQEHPGGRFYTVISSCPAQGARDGLVLSLTLYTPCSSMNSATLVARVKDSNNALLGVSVLNGVDLAAAMNGDPISMPPFDVLPVDITATISNVPTMTHGPSWHARYWLGDEPNMLEQVGDWSTDTGLVQLATQAYLVGDRTSFYTVMHHEGPPFSAHHRYGDKLLTEFELDASTLIPGILGASATTDGIAWTMTELGSEPELVIADIRWASVRGTITAPYTGTPFLSFDSLPDEVRPTTSPQLVQLQQVSVDGLDYHEVIPKIDQNRDLIGPRNTLPLNLSFWRSAYPSGS